MYTIAGFEHMHISEHTCYDMLLKKNDPKHSRCHIFLAHILWMFESSNYVQMCPCLAELNTLVTPSASRNQIFLELRQVVPSSTEFSKYV